MNLIIKHVSTSRIHRDSDNIFWWTVWICLVHSGFWFCFFVHTSSQEFPCRMTNPKPGQPMTNPTLASNTLSIHWQDLILPFVNNWWLASAVLPEDRAVQRATSHQQPIRAISHQQPIWAIASLCALSKYKCKANFFTSGGTKLPTI
jgi:hypothetical protein